MADADSRGNGARAEPGRSRGAGGSALPLLRQLMVLMVQVCVLLTTAQAMVRTREGKVPARGQSVELSLLLQPTAQ
jgi:hypothetical protein